VLDLTTRNLCLRLFQSHLPTQKIGAHHLNLADLQAILM
jgi:hypothetical protein